MAENKISNSETRPERWLPPWDGALYATNTGHHRAFDAWFLERFPVRSNDRVLDIGCGAGDFTMVVAGLVPDGEVVGLDPQPSMLDVARRRARPNQSFVLGAAQDARTLFGPTPFDVVMSRATMQWIPRRDHPGVHGAVYSVLRPGGWYRLEMGGAGNIAVTAAFLTEIAARHNGPRAPWSFLDAGEGLDLLEAAGFTVEAGDVRTVAQRRAFTRDELIGWFRSQAFQGWAPSMAPEDHRAFCAEVETGVGELRRADGTYDQTYVRLDALVRKPLSRA